MKPLLIIIIATHCMLFSCGKKGYGPRIKGKLVYTSCATAVVEVLDPSQFHLGQASWQQSSATPVYNNVFAVENICGFRNGNISVGDEFYFQLTNREDKACVICMLWDNPPSKTQRIIVVSK